MRLALGVGIAGGDISKTLFDGKAALEGGIILVFCRSGLSLTGRDGRH